ncbi:TD and POZ domain-containing protein 1-like [Cydia fagiglandana]|uniref:TD and POZ domain-containing protein 1-like n=1 Tax=Cydia fagiglandana TaxID=1458189 RepID=UPI002FEE52E5
MLRATDSMKMISIGKNSNSSTQSSLKLVFSIDALEQGTHISQIFDIYNIVDIQFLLKQHEDNEIDYYISAKKVESASTSNLKIKIQRACGDTHTCHFTCRDHWSQWQSIGTGSSNDSKRYLDLYCTVSITSNRINEVTISLHEDKHLTDFQLSTTDGNVAVHKAVLAANSPVFKTMLSGEWKETTEGCLQVKGVTLRTLNHLKNYMYLGVMPDSECDIRSLLLVAHCYLIDSLKKECIINLAQSVTSENLYKLLEFSTLNRIPELTYAILEAVPKYIVKICQKKMKVPKANH